MGLPADGVNGHLKRVRAIITMWPSIHSMVHENTFRNNNTN